MHTYELDGVTFHYNSDFSGDVGIVLANGQRLNVLASTILDFVGFCYVMPKRISELESATTRMLLLGEQDAT